MTHAIFVPGVGQYDNIGDIILRRQLLDWLRPLGTLHVYVGPAPAGYTEGLRLAPEDVVYCSFGAWYRAGLATAARSRTSYVFKPGEIQLSLIGMKEHVGMLPLLSLVRARGGVVARVGVGARNNAAVPRALMAPSIALSNLTAWRDGETAAYLGGRVMPDLAFGEGEAVIDETLTRDTLVVSMRSDRDEPSAAWIAGVRDFADRRSLRIVAVTQVLRDSARSRDLADRLGGEVLDWDGTDHAGQEERLRELYRRSAVAVSDRLHVLLAAFTEGAVPVAPLVDRSGKIARHFAAGGVTDIAFPTSGMDATTVAERITTVADRRTELFAALPGARADLAAVRGDLERALGGTRRAETAEAVRQA